MLTYLCIAVPQGNAHPLTEKHFLKLLFEMGRWQKQYTPLIWQHWIQRIHRQARYKSKQIWEEGDVGKGRLCYLYWTAICHTWQCKACSHKGCTRFHSDPRKAAFCTVSRCSPYGRMALIKIQFIIYLKLVFYYCGTYCCRREQLFHICPDKR